MSEQHCDESLAGAAAPVLPHPGSEWAFWPWAAVRAAGFPASLALGVVAPDAALAVDALLLAEARENEAREVALDALRLDVNGGSEELLQKLRRARRRVAKGKLPDPEDVVGIADAPFAALREATAVADAARAALPGAFEATRARLTRALREVSSMPSFREAVTWQNRPAVTTALDGLVRTDPEGASNQRQRRNEELVASYLQRYATKNDTIGFFGPVGWARIDEIASERIVVEPGPTLLASRTTFLEQWCIDTVAALLTADERAWPWLVPYRFGFLRIEGSQVDSPLTGLEQLTRAQELVLRACNGEATTRQLATELTRSHPGELATEEAVHAVIKELRHRKLVSVSLVLATTWRPDRMLRSRLERIEDAAVREALLRPLDELEACRAKIEAAAGDEERLTSALAGLDETFKRLTGAEPTRHAGAMYASRGLVYEDCRRNLDMQIGRRLLEEISPALDLVLTSARYLTHAVGQAYDVAFRELFTVMTKKTGARSVPFADFWFRAQRLFHGTKNRPIDGVAHDVQERWERILNVRASGTNRRVTYESADLRPAVAEAFAAPRAGWSSARHHSPDVMISAPSVEAIARGEYSVVLGEIHVALNTMDSWIFAGQHPRPGELTSLVARDLEGPRVSAVEPKDGLRMGISRGSRASNTPGDYELEVGLEASTLPRERVLRVGELRLEDDGERLVVVGNDGQFRVDLLELAGASTFGDITANALELLPDMQHSPRVTIDKAVVRRESWRFKPADLAFVSEDSDLERFVGARRWAREHGLPRFVYMRSSLEVKPIYVDFDNPTAVNIFARIVRRAKEHVSGTATLKFSEMLPTLEDTWLPDAQGNRYTSEIRFVVVDQRR